MCPASEHPRSIRAAIIPTAARTPLSVPMVDRARAPIPSMSLMIVCRHRGARHQDFGDQQSEIANLDGTHHLCPACKQMSLADMAVPLTDKCTVT